MSDKRTFILSHEIARRGAMRAVADAPAGYVIEIKPRTRSLEQNAAQWPILDAFSKQLLWPVNGEMARLSPQEFKDILTAAFRQEKVRVAEGLNGGVVMLGDRTKLFSVAEFSEWLEFLYATAADRGVNLSRVREIEGEPA